MKQKSGPVKQPAEEVVRDLRRATRRQFSAEEKIRIVLEGLRGEDSIAELCRREGIASSMYYGWSSTRICRSVEPWKSSASRGPRSTAGTISSRPAGPRL